ncbi:MAG: hypothetical protein QNJ16_06840 [Rhodobacter sp.]|nr:hypothetical protein [Rhodobacter sp.]
MRTLALAAALALPVHAQALECVVETPEWLWYVATESKDRMLPVYGRFSRPLGPVELGGVVAMDMREARFSARFEGRALTKRGFTHRMQAEVEVDVPCIDAACADLPYGKPVMALLTETAAGWELNLGPCVDPLIEYPSPAERHRMRDCLRGRCADEGN